MPLYSFRLLSFVVALLLLSSPSWGTDGGGRGGKFTRLGGLAPAVDPTGEKCQARRGRYQCENYASAQGAVNPQWDAQLDQMARDYCAEAQSKFGGDVEKCVEDKKIVENTKRSLTCVSCFINPPAPVSPALPKPAAPNDAPSTPERPPELAKEKPPENDSTISGGCAAQECLGKAADTQNQAGERAEKEAKNFDRLGSGTEDVQESTISSSNEILDRWQKDLARRPNASEQEFTHFRQDQQLVNQAEASRERKPGSFTVQNAENAYDPGIRGALTTFAEAAELKEDSAKAENYFLEEAAQFRGLARQSGARALSLQSGRENAAVAARGIASLDSKSLVARAAGTDLDAGEGAAALTAGEPGPTAGGDKLVLASSVGNGASRDAKLRALRDSLQRKVGSEGEKANPEALGDSFQKGLGLPQFMTSADVPEAGSLTGDLIAEARAAGGSSSRAHSGLQDLFEGASLGSLGSGLLGVETADLFQRVRKAHESCVLRECVKTRP